LGKVSVFQKEFESHVRVLLGLQHTGDAEVMNALADAFQMGFGVEANPEEAIDRFRVASQAGHTKAMVRLGRILGRHDINQLEESRYWFHKAADGGYAGGMVALGFVYRDGKGVPVDSIKAAEWFSKALDAGDIQARILLAKVYYFSLDATDKALPLLLDEAERNNMDSFKVLGAIYGDDRTTYYDFEKAVYWYELVANGKYAGSADAARIALAELNLSGKRQPKNIVKAREYLDAVLSNAPEKHTLRKEALKLLGKIDKGKV
jgi:TPR repeat protein